MVFTVCAYIVHKVDSPITTFLTNKVLNYTT